MIHLEISFLHERYVCMSKSKLNLMRILQIQKIKTDTQCYFVLKFLEN